MRVSERAWSLLLTLALVVMLVAVAISGVETPCSMDGIPPPPEVDECRP